METRETLAAVSAIIVFLILVISLFVVLPSIQSRGPREISIVFSETGLKTGQTWNGYVVNYVEVNGTSVAQMSSFSSSNSTAVVNITNFQDRALWSINSSSWYEASRPYGLLNSTTGSSLEITEAFQRMYVLNFEKNKMPAVEPDNLTVFSANSYYNFTSHTGFSSPLPLFDNNNTTISFKTTNGTYYYQVNSRYVNNTLFFPMYNETVNLNGFAKITVSGENITTFLSYTTHTYNLYVSETGFPSNQPGWNFSIDGSESDSYNNHAGGYYNMRFLLPDGTYHYAAETIGGFLGYNAIGSVTINGSDVKLVIRY